MDDLSPDSCELVTSSFGALLRTPVLWQGRKEEALPHYSQSFACLEQI